MNRHTVWHLNTFTFKTTAAYSGTHIYEYIYSLIRIIHSSTHNRAINSHIQLRTNTCARLFSHANVCFSPTFITDYTLNSKLFCKNEMTMTNKWQNATLFISTQLVAALHFHKCIQAVIHIWPPPTHISMNLNNYVQYHEEIFIVTKHDWRSLR